MIVDLDDFHIILTKEDKKYLWELGCARNAPKSPDRSRKSSSKWTDEEIDYLGAKGETASYVFGEEMDTAIYGSRGDDGYDVVLPGIGKTAIKFNHRHKGYFLVERPRDFAAPTEAAISVYGECDPLNDVCYCRDMDREEKIVLGGWIKREEFWEKPPYFANWRHGPRWYVRQSQLRPIQELYGIVMAAKKKCA